LLKRDENTKQQHEAERKKIRAEKRTDALLLSPTSSLSLFVSRNFPHTRENGDTKKKIEKKIEKKKKKKKGTRAKKGGA
jgi:hypothetical protein